MSESGSGENQVRKTAAGGGAGPAARRRRANPLNKIGIGLIGAGDRGKQHIAEALATGDCQLRAVCDIYTRRLDWAVETVKKSNPNVRGYRDYRNLLEDKDVDAIIVATPDHWHSRMTIDGAHAGKDVYVQKCLTRTVEEAQAIVKAVKETRSVLQLGHTRRSQPVYHRMKEIYGSGILGPVSLVNISIYRNSAQGAWDWAIDKDATPEMINWNEFLGSAPSRPFDPDRYFRWRKYWDYGTGISGDLLSHEWDAVNFVMGLGIPSTCIASGGIYYWKEKREVPDVFNAVSDYPERKLAVVWNCTFSNSASGVNLGTMIYGKHATIEYGRGGDLEVYVEPKGKTDFSSVPGLEKEAGQPGERREPLYRFSRSDKLYVTGHFQNFLDCVRSRGRTRCNEDEAFQEAVTAIMSVKAYKERRMVRWDPLSQKIA
jgi:predicted dehydrogenase